MDNHRHDAPALILFCLQLPYESTLWSVCSFKSIQDRIHRRFAVTHISTLANTPTEVRKTLRIDYWEHAAALKFNS